MEAEQFERYLKRGGRSQSAVARCTMYVTEFENYLRTSRNDTALEEAEPEDLIEFVKSLDREKKTKSKGYLWAIRNYYTFEHNPELSNLAGLLREERIERKPFLLKGFMGVNQVYIDALAEHDIRNIDQMLVAGATRHQRSALAERTVRWWNTPGHQVLMAYQPFLQKQYILWRKQEPYRQSLNISVFRLTTAGRRNSRG